MSFVSAEAGPRVMALRRPLRTTRARRRDRAAFDLTQTGACAMLSELMDQASSLEEQVNQAWDRL